VEENGQVIAVRLYAGDEDDEDNSEEGLVTGFDAEEEASDVDE
jgi:hypothetical protein